MPLLTAPDRGTPVIKLVKGIDLPNMPLEHNYAHNYIYVHGNCYGM